MKSDICQRLIYTITTSVAIRLQGTVHQLGYAIAAKTFFYYEKIKIMKWKRYGLGFS